MTKSFSHFDNNFKLSFSFALLFGLVPYRIFGILGLPPLQKLGMGILFLIFFYLILKDVVPLLLNSHLIQTFFYYCLLFEEYLYRVSFSLALLIAFGIPFQIVLAASHSEDPFFWYSLMLLFSNLYLHFKRIFLNPEFEYALYRDSGIDEVGFLNWDLIVLNMSAISTGLFKTPVENQLGKTMSEKPFPFIAKRYVFTRAVDALKGKGEAIAAIGVMTGLSTAVYGEYRTTVRHEENLRVTLESSEIQADALVKAAEKKATAKIEIAQQMKRANDLKEKELTLLQKSSTKSAFDAAETSSLFSKLFSFFSG